MLFFEAGVNGGDGTLEHLTGGAVDGNEITFLDLSPVDAELASIQVDPDGLSPSHARLAPAPGHHCRVGGHPSVLGQDALGLDHAVHIVGVGLRTDQDDRLTGLAPLLGCVGVKDGHARGRPRRGVEPHGQQLALILGLSYCFRVESGMQELVNLSWDDPHQGFFLGDQALVDHVHRDLDRCRCGALAGTGLEHPQFAPLDGELYVLHVAVVLFQELGDFPELLINL